MKSMDPAKIEPVLQSLEDHLFIQFAYVVIAATKVTQYLPDRGSSV
jgi:hypothetical protein